MTARYLAVKALLRQEEAGYANLVLDGELRRCTPPLAARDAAFAARIFYTVLEYRNRLDWMLQQFVKKPLTRLDAPVRAILRAGLAQAACMAVPLPAAVNESVKLTRAFGKSSAAGMVNAVLRRAAALQPTGETFPDRHSRLVTYYSLSEPVASLLEEQYGAQAEDIAAAFHRQQPTWVRVNTLRTTTAELADRLAQEDCRIAPGPWDNCLQVEFPGSPAATRAFRQGDFHVQGLTSQYAADCVEARPGMRVLDLCAAPGGKTLTLAQAMQDQGELWAGEAVSARLPLLRQALERGGVRCAHTFCGDASVEVPAFRAQPFDRILCDVPCSGLGVIGKKPDIRYKDLDGLDELCALQRRILQTAAGYLAPGGRLVYSTCTINRNENEGNIQDFLAKNPDFRLQPAHPPLPGADCGEWGTLFLPHKTGTDGFFVAALTRSDRSFS